MNHVLDLQALEAEEHVSMEATPSVQSTLSLLICD